MKNWRGGNSAGGRTVYNSRTLFFMPDPLHVFKNLRLALTEGKTCILSETTVSKFELPSNKVNLQCIEKIVKFEDNKPSKLVPRSEK